MPPALALAGYPDPRVKPFLPRCSLLFYHGDPNMLWTPDKFSGFMADLFVTRLPEFQAPHGRLRPLMLTITAVMIMHFSAAFKKHGRNHSFPRTMMNAAVVCKMATTQTEAITLLAYWSDLIMDEFKKGNTGNLSDVPSRRSLPDQVSKMNDTVSQLLAAKMETQATLTQMQQYLRAIKLELNAATISVRHCSDQSDNLLTQNRLIALQNRAIMRKLGMEVDNDGTAEESLRLERDLVALNNLRERAVQPLPAAPVPVQEEPVLQPPQQMVRLEDALAHPQPINVNPRGKREFKTKIEEVLKTMFKVPRNHLFSQLRGPAPYLEMQATWVHANVFDRRDKSLAKIKRALRFVDAMWTPAERTSVMNGALDPLQAIDLFNLIAKRCVAAKHVFQHKSGKLPKNPRPGGNAGSNMLGVANSLSHLNIDSYIPKWDGDGSIAAPCTLDELAETKRQKIVRTRNPY